jgi:hypothetical protein
MSRAGWLLVVVAVGCSGGAKAQRVSAPGNASNIVRGGDHVAYLADVGSGTGATGDLHVAGTTPGSDTRVAGKVSAGGFVLSPDGATLFFTQLTSSNTDASLSWYDVKHGGAPRVLFAHGLKTAPNDPEDTSSGVHADSFADQLFFFSPSGKYFVIGVLAPNVMVDADLHVIETASGNDVLQRGNGAFAYIQTVLPDDTLLFQDAVGGDSGPGGPTALLQLFWTRLGSGTAPAAIDARVANFAPNGDNTRLIYQRSDRSLFAWDATARPAAAGTALATGAVSFAVGTSAVVYSTGDGGIHVIGSDGTPKLDVTSAGADVNSPLYLSLDDHDVYYFQAAEPQNSRGTLMHVAVAGSTPQKLDEHAGLYDLQILPHAILYLRNVDATGSVGDAVTAARDGSWVRALGVGVPVAPEGLPLPQNHTPGGLIVSTGPSGWLAAHLTGARTDMTRRLVDGGFATLGGLGLATMNGENKIEASTRAGAYQLADDAESLIYISAAKLNLMVDNYVGSLSWIATATPTMKPVPITLDDVSELSSVHQRGLFAVANGKSPGVYFVSY